MRPMHDDEDEDMAAIGSVMAADAEPTPAPEDGAGGGDPATILADLKAKLAELEALIGAGA